MNTNGDTQRLTEISFIIVDFETVTPPKRPPEPIELAAMRIVPALRIDRQWKANWLIKPPDGVPLTPFDTRQTGIGEEDLADKPSAAVILHTFETLVCQEQETFPAFLVAHNASYDAHIIWRWASICPTLAALPCVDTIALAKHVLSQQSSYRLDALAQYFSLPLPQNRHRALPDVQLTIQIFLRLISLYLREKPAATGTDLKHLACITRPKQPVLQMSLFSEEKGE